MLEIIPNKEHYLVRKFTKNPDYSNRLFIQANKQKKFSNNSVFCAPYVFNIESERNIPFFDMEYIPGEKYSEYFLHCSVSELNKVIDHFILFINTELDQAKFENIQGNIFIHKINSIRNLLNETSGLNSSIFRNLEYLGKNIPSTPIPIGPCHGDLTFSNIIFCNNKLYLIDFLDSFIESPLLDLVKLRQDTKFYWSRMLEKDLAWYKRNKVMQVLRYFDQCIVEAFKSKDYYKNWYPYLEKFNLLRIFPYLHDKKEIDFITVALNNT